MPGIGTSSSKARVSISWGATKVLSGIGENVYCVDRIARGYGKKKVFCWRNDQDNIGNRANEGSIRSMKAQFEKVPSGHLTITAVERVDGAFPFYWHYHPEFELTLIRDSEGQRLVGDSVADYGPGDLVLLGPNLPHSWRSGPVKSAQGRLHTALVIQFRRDFLGEQLLELHDMEPLTSLLMNSAGGLAFGDTDSGRAVASKLEDFLLLSPARRVVALLSVLLDLAEATPQRLSTRRLRPMCRLVDQQKIDTICRYLEEHFDAEIDFDVLSELVHMDHTSLCRFFKRATGRTMTAYVNEYRVGAATQMLTHTDKSVLDIGFEVGFGNYSHFNRQFQRIKGRSPRDLRRKFSELHA